MIVQKLPNIRKQPTRVMDLRSGFIVDSDQTEKSISIKGFASVEMVDRQNEIADPMSFNVGTFLNDGTVLVNHAPWIDARGNKVRVGRVKNLIPAFISGESGDNWVISDIVSKAIISDFPKSKVPEMGIGSRGLFAFVDITQPEVMEMVKNGEFNHFSWRGLTHKNLDFVNNEPVYRFTKVDLWELSIVNIPVANQSAFVATKGLSEDLYVNQVLLPKNEFQTHEAIKGFLKDHDLSCDNLRDSGDFICALQDDPEVYDTIKSVRVKLGGADLIMSPKKEIPEDKKSVLNPSLSKGVKMSLGRLYTFSDEALAFLFGDNYSTSSKSVVVGENEFEVVDVKPGKKMEEDVDFMKLIDDKFNEINGKLNLDQVSAKIEELTQRNAELNTKLEALTTVQNTVTTETQATEVTAGQEVEAVKSLAVEVLNKYNELQAAMTAIQQSQVAFASLIQKITPNSAQRSESAKSVQQEADPMTSWMKSVLNSR